MSSKPPQNSHLSDADRNLLESFRIHYQSMNRKYILEPSTEILPEFLKDKDIDAIAIDGNQCGGIVVQLRHLAADEVTDKLERISEAITKSPDWRLDIVLSIPSHSEGGYLLPSTGELEHHLDALRVQTKRFEAGEEAIGDYSIQLLILWPLFEAAGRRALADVGINLTTSVMNSKAIIEQLLDADIISDSDAEFLVGILIRRNALAHGFLHERVNGGELRQLDAIVRNLSSTKKRPAA